MRRHPELLRSPARAESTRRFAPDSAGDPHRIQTSDPQIMNQLTILFSMLQLVTCC